ncbi:sigma-70 family RNA polymerase sigma factor [Streptomyces sp. Ru62]|uniref:sigma-70 family RNA polymerase sigma factor n=1 Tax=Streptomyces sp. Ru62 TaxID=2080745 RepID=UPI0015E315CE|nr:sigma-70 family RNA polymerase sigma factor [Streptomyces sp. Ru62]
MTTPAPHGTPPQPRHHLHVQTLVTRHRAALVTYAEKLLSDRHLAEDIVQEAFVRAWRHTDELRDGPGSTRGWLLKVTRNLIIDRSRSALVRHESVTDQMGDVPQRDHAGRVLAAMEAQGLLRSLSDEHREVLVHTCMYGFTVHETARRLGIPAGTVKSRRHYALYALRHRAGA